MTRTRKMISLLLAFALIFTSIGCISMIKADAASPSITIFSVSKTKVSNGYKITVKATFPKGSSNRVLSLDAPPGKWAPVKSFSGTGKKSCTFTATFTKSEYKRAKKRAKKDM